MDQITITEEKMVQLIELYNNAAYAFKKATKELAAVGTQIEANTEPLAPTIDEYNAYRKAAHRFNTVRMQQQEAVDNNDAVLKNARVELFKVLPANKWIKAGKYYIGHRTDNWPGSDGDLLITTEKPTVELKMQIVN